MRNETVSNYVIRLKQASKYCEFGADADNQIREQILDKWSDIEIKRKWYSEKDLKLDKLLEIARTFQYRENTLVVDRQNNDVGHSGSSSAGRHSVSYVKFDKWHDKSQSGHSVNNNARYRCGETGHYQHECPHNIRTLRVIGVNIRNILQVHVILN